MAAPGSKWVSIAVERPAYGAECQGLGFSIVVMGERLVGFAGGLMVLGGWTRSCVVGGGHAPVSGPT